MTHWVWLARQGFGVNAGPLVRPRITNFADGSGIGEPSERFCGIPMPLGHCGQLTSPPSTGPVYRGGRLILGTLMEGVASTGRSEGFAEGLVVADAAAVGDAVGVGAPSAFFDFGSSGAQPAPTRTTRSATSPGRVLGVRMVLSPRRWALTG